MRMPGPCSGRGTVACAFAAMLICISNTTLLILLPTAMPLLSCAIFQLVHWAARKGLRDDSDSSPDQRKLAARRTGIRGETYAYWYLRRHGYVFVARNYTPRGVKGELDLVGYDG